MINQTYRNFQGTGVSTASLQTKCHGRHPSLRDHPQQSPACTAVCHGWTTKVGGHGGCICQSSTSSFPPSLREELSQATPPFLLSCSLPFSWPSLSTLGCVSASLATCLPDDCLSHSESLPLLFKTLTLPSSYWCFTKGFM